MNLSYRDILTILYGSIVVLGLVLLVIAWYVWQKAKIYSAEPYTQYSHWFTAVILATVGIGLIFFGVETYLLRDDPDIWS